MNIQNELADHDLIKNNGDDKYDHPVYPRIKSFVNAGKGIYYFFRNEYNARIHLLAAVGVIILCTIYPVSRTEIMLLAFAIALVWVSEMINTAIEKAMDFISVEKHEAIRIVKDVAAGAVLTASCVAAVTGAIIFIPKIFYV